MDIERFDLERWQSIHEHDVEINLSESGVQPLRLRDIVETADLSDLLGQELGYTQTNGTATLRERVAALYDGASAANVLVTNGGSEANFVTCWHLIEPGDEVVVVQPTYMQIPGLARSFGATVREVWLEACYGGHGDNTLAPSWRLDLDAVRAAVTPRTRCIAVCNPNNPTGARLDEAEVSQLCTLAEDLGCWVLADEIYRGAELDGRNTPSVWGRHDRVIVTGGLSKAYGLPGLRIGWIAGPAELVEQLWGRHDYTTIAPGAINDLLARLALDPSRRARLLARTRGRLRENQAIRPGVGLAPARCPADPTRGRWGHAVALPRSPALGRGGRDPPDDARRAGRARRALRTGIPSARGHRRRRRAAPRRSRAPRAGTGDLHMSTTREGA